MVFGLFASVANDSTFGCSYTCYGPLTFLTCVLCILTVSKLHFRHREARLAPPLGINLAGLGLEFCWGFRCFASMPHGRVHRPCPPTTSRYYLSSYPPCTYLYVHAFAVFLRVSKMLYGTASGLWGSIWHALGSNSAGVPLFRKHASRMRSSAMSAYTRRYVQLSAMRPSIPAFVHAFSCFFDGFRRCCSAPPLGINFARLGLEFCWGSAVSPACLTDAFIGYVRLYAPICPAISAMMRL